MSKVIIPEGYKPHLGMYETQMAIGLLKRIFENKLCSAQWQKVYGVTQVA